MPGQSPLSMMRPPEQRAQRPLPAPVRRGRRWPIFAPLAAVLLLAIAWTALWYFSAATADRTLAGWVEREAAAGRVYSCGAQTIGGFPFSIQAHCADASAEIKSIEPPYAVAAKAINFAAAVYQPTRLVGDVTGPLTMAALGQPPNLTADWRRARIVVRGVPPDPDGVSIELDVPHLDRIASGEAIFKARHADLRGQIAAGSPSDHPVIDMTLRLAGATAPTLHALLAQPTEAQFDALVRGFKDLSPKPWANRFREMQAANGGIEIKSLRITQADAIVVGSGTLNLGANGKINGVLSVAIAGIEHIVPRLGLDRLIGQGLDQLSGSNGTLDRLVPGLSDAIRDTANANVVDNLKKMGQPTSIDNQPAIALPLRLSDGAIYLGMLRIGEVPPLF
jgi:hypothetical protein